MADVEHIISHISASDAVKKKIESIYKRIAAAESQVHGVPVSEIHFHEVGAMDAIADVAAVCYLLEKLSVQKIYCSPIHVGSGTVKCAHGILPVPAPATALILKDIPIYSTDTLGELCTPTGAALLADFADSFGSMPEMKVSAYGYGMGKKDFEKANCVRVFLGEASVTAGGANDTADGLADSIYELSCNIDDMTAEDLAFAREELLVEGMLDVFFTSISMKKGRPGTMLTVLCRPSDKEKAETLIFRHTTTLGIRECEKKRVVLRRGMETVSTEYGDIKVKTAEGFGVKRSKPEYEDLACAAREHGVRLSVVRSAAEANTGKQTQ